MVQVMDIHPHVPGAGSLPAQLINDTKVIHTVILRAMAESARS
jgi:hypothetical protein